MLRLFCVYGWGQKCVLVYWFFNIKIVLNFSANISYDSCIFSYASQQDYILKVFAEIILEHK